MVVLVLWLRHFVGKNRQAREPKNSLAEDPDKVVESESSTNTECWLVRRGIVFKSAAFVQHLSLREENPQVHSKKEMESKVKAGKDPSLALIDQFCAITGK